MTKEESMKLKCGLYDIFWKAGGSSVAAVGMTGNGDRWLAPTNWTSPAFKRDVWKGVNYVTLICTQKDKQ